MSVHTLEVKPVVSVASALKVIKSPLKIPAWSVGVLLIMAGIYGYVSGRQNPIHHYVPYVGYPLVLDTTTGKACYSTTPKASEDPGAVNASYAFDGGGAQPDVQLPMGPPIPMCQK
ncbi:MAG TPA: hypothetical protein VFD98_16630 [Terracidiphilus sp.]|jgi:hypothetical protein|nr:hypothetical protein [Terracidiphilus sp.]